MTALSEVSVIPSAKLLSQLRARSADLGVPLTWLAAGLVCDTIESLADQGRPQAAPESILLRDYARKMQ
jgi:hypothetical protein